MGTTTKEKSRAKQVAAAILQQLGGYRFLVMTGAKPLLCGEDYATFKLARNASGANFMKVTLTPMDVYDVEFIRVRGMKRETVAQHEGIYDDMLQPIFTKVTGMYTTL